MLFFSRSKSLLGIDIGTSYIKAVQLKQGNQRAELQSYGMVHVVYPDKLESNFDVLGETSKILAGLYEKAKFTTKKVVLSIPSNVAFVSIFTLPAMPEKEMQKSIEYKAKRYIPLPLSDVNLSWQILSERPVLITPEPSDKAAGKAQLPPDQPGDKKQNHHGQEKEMEVLITAVAKNVVNNYLNIVSQAGFEPVALEVESLSQIRALVPAGSKEDILLVDVGAKATNLAVVHEGNLTGSRHLAMGGDTITADIAHSFGVSLERAEQMKKTPESTSASMPLQKIAQNVVDAVVSESEQLIKIMSNQGRTVSKIILTGGGSKFPGFEKALMALNQEVVYGDALQKISYDPSLDPVLQPAAAQLTTAVGLALRSY